MIQGKTSVIGNTTFVDPLNYNSVYFGFDVDSESRNKYYNLNYINQKKLLNWGLLFDSEPSQTLGNNSAKSSVRGLLKYHFKRYNDIDLFLTGSSGIGLSDSKANFDNYFGLDLIRQYYNVISYDPFEYQSLYSELDFDIDGLQLGLLANFYKSIDDNVFLGAEAFGQFSLREWFDVGRMASGRRIIYPMINRTLFKDQSQYFASVTVGAKAVFEINGYNEYFPLGIRRWAAEGFAGMSKYDGTLLSYEGHYGAELEFELVFAKRFIQRLEIGVINTSTGIKQFYFGLTDGF